MPNCFSLQRRSDGETEYLNRVDEIVCERLNVPCDPVKWYASWYDVLGPLMAHGWDADRLRALFLEEPVDFHSQKMLNVLGVLETEYTWSAWYTPKR